MANDFGYVDPVQRAREHQRMARLNVGQVPLPLPEPISPLASLDQALPEIIGNGWPSRRAPVVADAAVGAALGGLLGAWLSRRAARRAQRLQEMMTNLGIGQDE